MRRSEELFRRAEQIIPWGTQTNAKRPDEGMRDVMPLFIEEADGCRIRDVDGRWYIDYRSALGPIILGYRNRAVDDAVRAQMERGVLFSMASPLEVEVAGFLVERLPGVEKIRFMKTGENANAAAVRLARAFTGRDHLVTCGYHGHSDWFSCGEGKEPLWTRRERNGVPRTLDALVTRLPYGDTAEAERIFGEKGDRVAAVIMVAYDWNEHVAREFVLRMRELTRAHGALLIFDEVLTGFRLARAGAREYFGVIPDLSTYAKAMANGYPLAAFAGRAEVMDKLYDVTLTSTYAGETLSLAAARATLEMILDGPVLEHVWAMGERLARGFDEAAAQRDLPFRAFGLPPAVQFRFDADEARDAELRSAFFRQLYRKGIFAARPFLLSYAHKTADVEETLAAMGEALDAVAEMPAVSN